jgi:sterol desaturase/sphingolipid hydroxylase (fatty acid hydroxylase superfamily)
MTMTELEITAQIEALYADREIWFQVIDLIALGFIGLAVLELGWDMASKTRRKISETFANLMVAAGYSITGLLFTGTALIIAYIILQPYALFQIEMDTTGWILAILLADLTYYWMHRLEHEIRMLWAYHVVHHSSPEFDLTTAYRLSWVEGLFEWLFLVPMLLVGFDAITVFVAISVVVSYQTWIHTQKIHTLGVLDYLFNTPSVHRVHHGSNDKYLDKNYGGILMLWDHLFSTYQAEEEAVVFGVTEPIKSINPLVINFHEYGAILRDCVRAKNWGERLSYIFRHPGWAPEGSKIAAPKANKADKAA